MIFLIIEPDSTAISAEANLPRFLSPDNRVHSRRIRQFLEIGMLLIIDTSMCPVIIKNHSETDNSHPIFVVSGIKDTPYGTRIVQSSHRLQPVNAEFLVFRLNLTNTAAEHAYPHLIVMRTLYRAYFIVRQFSNFTTRQVIFERIEIILIVHDTQTATGAHPYTMRLVLLDSIYVIIKQ